MKVFVTGGSGFIGKALITELTNAGHVVVAICRSDAPPPDSASDIRWFAGHDLSDVKRIANIFRECKPAACIHLAWEGLPDYSYRISRRNVDHSLSLYRLAAKAGCSSILTAGSCWEYSNRHGAISESHALESSTIFPAAKNACRLIGEAIANEFGTMFYWLRLFYTYGPGQRPRSLIPSIVQSVLLGHAPNIATPQNRNDFVYVHDAARAICRVMEEQPSSVVYNVGSGYSTRVGDIVQQVSSLMGRTTGDVHLDEAREGTLVDFHADISRISKDTGWKPTTSLESGLQKTIHYWRKRS